MRGPRSNRSKSTSRRPDGEGKSRRRGRKRPQHGRTPDRQDKRPSRGQPRGHVPDLQPRRAKVSTFDELLAGLPEPVQAVGWRLREIIHDVLPNVEESVYLAWKVAIYREPSEICGIQPVQKRYINFYFSNGSKLPDPDGLLEGTGNSSRHLKIHTVDDIPVERVKELILEARKLVKKGPRPESS